MKLNKTHIFLLSIFILVMLVFSSCSKQSFVCPDNSVVDDPSLCPVKEDVKEDVVKSEPKVQTPKYISNLDLCVKDHDYGLKLSSSKLLSENSCSGYILNSETHYYKLIIDGGELWTFNVKPLTNADIKLKLFNKDFKDITDLTFGTDYIDSNGNGKSEQIIAVENSGNNKYIYYVSIQSDKETEYELSLKTKRQNDANSGSDAPDDFSSDIKIKTNTEYSGILGKDDKVDFYAVPIKPGEKITFSFVPSSNLDVAIELYNFRKTSLNFDVFGTSSLNGVGKGLEETKLYSFSNNDDKTYYYYVKVYYVDNSAGSYTFKISAEMQNDVYSHIDASNNLHNPTIIKKTYYDGNFVGAGDDVDYYKVVLDDDKKRITVIPDENLDVELDLYAPNGKDISWSESRLDEYNQNTFGGSEDINVNDAGEYIFAVKARNGYGNYKFLIQ